jgi:hypothetical protein
MRNRKNLISDEDSIIATKELSSIKQELDSWRLLEKRPHRLPEEFWLRAAKLASHFSTNKIARALKIDFNRLKKHIGLTTIQPQKADKSVNISGEVKKCSLKKNFIELQFPQISASSSPIAEVTSNKGNNLKIFTSDCSVVTKLMESFLSL